MILKWMADVEKISLCDMNSEVLLERGCQALLKRLYNYILKNYFISFAVL
jgi:hypothetical protein